MAAADQSGPSPQRAGVALLLALAVAAAVGGLSGWRPAASAATAGGVPAPAHARASAASKSPHTPPPPSWDASLVYTPTGQHHLAGDLLNLPHDGLAPATRAVQRWLYEWQYAPPGGCAAARFAVGNLDLPLGMGAQLHLASAMLAMAIGQGRIFLWCVVGAGEAGREGAVDKRREGGPASPPVQPAACLPPRPRSTTGSPFPPPTYPPAHPPAGATPR